jgi:hypothetical protein
VLTKIKNAKVAVKKNQKVVPAPGGTLFDVLLRKVLSLSLSSQTNQTMRVVPQIFAAASVFLFSHRLDTRYLLVNKKKSQQKFLLHLLRCSNIIYLIKHARKDGSSSDGEHESFLTGARECRRISTIRVCFLFIYLFRIKTPREQRIIERESFLSVFVGNIFFFLLQFQPGRFSSLSLSLSLSLSCAPFVFIDETREICRAFSLPALLTIVFFSSRASFSGRKGENINQNRFVIFSQPADHSVFI